MTPEKAKETIAKWNDLATRHDDLKFALITLGQSFGNALKSMQDEFHQVEKEIEDLESTMNKADCFWFPDSGSPYFDQKRADEARRRSTR